MSVIRRRRAYSASGLYLPVEFRCRSVCRSVCPLITNVYFTKKTTDSIKMPFGIVGGLGPRNRELGSWRYTSAPSGKYSWTIVRGGYESVCHQEWRRGLFPNYCGQSCLVYEMRRHSTSRVLLSSGSSLSDGRRSTSLPTWLLLIIFRTIHILNLSSP